MVTLREKKLEYNVSNAVEGLQALKIVHHYAIGCFDYSLSPGVWQSFVTIRSCNHLMRIISTYVDNTKKSEIS